MHTIYFFLKPQDVFEHYVQKLSNVMRQNNATVNFALIGACDGTHDRTLTQGFMLNSHWRAVMVEPVESNYRDLVSLIAQKGLKRRTHTIRAAVTETCHDPFVFVKSVNFENKAYNFSRWGHWRARQKGAIVPVDSETGEAKLPSDIWKSEQVRCITGREVMEEWTAATRRITTRKKKRSNTAHVRRPHILKIDAEGQEFSIISSLLASATCDSELPLLINFEAKVLGENYLPMRQLLQRR